MDAESVFEFSNYLLNEQMYDVMYNVIMYIVKREGQKSGKDDSEK